MIQWGSRELVRVGKVVVKTHRASQRSPNNEEGHVLATRDPETRPLNVTAMNFLNAVDAFFSSALTATVDPQAQITMTKYILVSGGVVSGIGKGVIGTPRPTISLLCAIVQARTHQPLRPACS